MRADRTSPAASPRQLSGGQQQRVALARALVNHPEVLLLDEPLGALDLKLRREMQVELKRIQTEVGLTFVHVTHDQEEAMTMADTVAVMNKGRIEQLGRPASSTTCRARAFVANFLGQSNLLRAGRLQRPDGDTSPPTSTAAGWWWSAPSFRPGWCVGPDLVGHRLAGPWASGRRSSACWARTARPATNRLAGTVTDVSFRGVATSYLVDDAVAGTWS